MIVIDYKDARPIYEQVVSKFAKLIVRGVLSPGDKMPSVRMLAIELSINPNTIQKAYMELERQGYIYTVKGKGSFVSECNNLSAIEREKCLNKLRETVTEVLSLGISIEDIKAVCDEMG